MVDEGMVPQSLQKPLQALEKRGNPYGKMEKKRAEWTKEIAEEQPVKVVGKKETAETLFFVDSVTSYDDQVQGIGRATAKILGAAGADFGILGKDEKDSGNEVRRFGEEMLFLTLKEEKHGSDPCFRGRTDRHRRSPCLKRPEERLRGPSAGTAYQPVHCQGS